MTDWKDKLLKTLDDDERALIAQIRQAQGALHYIKTLRAYYQKQPLKNGKPDYESAPPVATQ